MINMKWIWPTSAGTCYKLKKVDPTQSPSWVNKTDGHDIPAPQAVRKQHWRLCKWKENYRSPPWAVFFTLFKEWLENKSMLASNNLNSDTDFSMFPWCLHQRSRIDGHGIIALSRLIYLPRFQSAKHQIYDMGKHLEAWYSFLGIYSPKPRLYSSEQLNSWEETRRESLATDTCRIHASLMAPQRFLVWVPYRAKM